MVQFIAGVKSQDSNSRTTLTNIISGCFTAIKNKYYEFQSTGQALMVQFIAGIKAKDSAVSNTFTQIISGALTTIENKYTDFYNAGKYLVEGFAAGISANMYKAEAKARAMAAAAARAAERELDVNSPSRVFYGIGDYAGRGFVNALSDYESKSYDASSRIAESAKNGLSKAISQITDIINSDIDTQPTIRPVIDMTDVESGIKSTFSKTQGLNVSGTTSRASSVASGLYKETSSSNPSTSSQNGGEQGVYNEFKIASLVVREEADVKRVARQLYQLQLAGNRG